MRGVRKQRETTLLRKDELRKLSIKELEYLRNHFVKVSKNYTGIAEYKMLNRANKVFTVLQEKGLTYNEMLKITCYGINDDNHLDKFIYRNGRN